MATLLGSRDFLDQFTHVQLAIAAIQGIGGNPNLTYAVVRIVMDMQTGIPLADFEQIYVRTVLAGFVTGRIVVMADLVARLPDGLLPPDTEGMLISTIDGHNLVVSVDHDKRLFMAIDQ
jgi:hypothetical protein